MTALNWKKLEACVAAGKAKEWQTEYMHNVMDEHTQTRALEKVQRRSRCSTPADCPDAAYYLPTPKSPHGVDVDPTGEFIVAGGKLATVIPVHSFSKMKKAIADKAFDGERERYPGPQVRGGHRWRSAEPRPRPAAHGVRRQGLRLHLDLHLVGDREVDARHLGSRGSRSRPTTRSATS